MRLTFLIIFLTILYSGPAFTQSPDYYQRLAFSDQVQKIKYWAYIDGDTAFRCYTDVIQAIEDLLNRKGYDIQRLAYQPGDSLSPRSWKERQLKKLLPNQAFLEIRIKLITDSVSERGSPTTLMVQDASGRVYAQHSLRPESENVLYTSVSEASLYFGRGSSDTSGAGLFYSRKNSIMSPEISRAATGSIRGIPAAHHPVVRQKPVYLNKGGFTWFEFAFYGGYCAGATIPVTGGEVTFRPGPDYGLEFMVNIYEGFDFAIGYKREDTFAGVDSPRYPKEGDLALSNNYILLSCVYRFLHHRNLQPYLGFDFGSVNVVMKDKLFRDVWYFAVGGRAGLNWYVTNVLGFRLQTQLLYQVHPQDAPFIYSDEIRVMPHPINAMNDLPQFDVTLGLMIRLGK